MAPVKRPYDVISIASDSSEDNLARPIRPHKTARLDEPHWRPGLDIDDYMAQNDLHTGPIMPRHDGVNGWIMPRDSEEPMRTGIIKDEPIANYDIDEWIAENDRQELMRTNPTREARNAVNEAEPGASAAHPQSIESDDHDFGPPFKFDLNDIPLLYGDAPNLQDGAILVPDTAPTPERSQLDQILDVVPDVSHDHVTKLLGTDHGNLEQVLNILLEGKYPKESDRRAAEQAAKEAALQEQKAAEEARMESLINPQCAFSSKMKEVIIEVLKNEFNKIPVKYIKEVQKDKKHLYATYLALNEATHAEPCPFGKTPWRPIKEVNFDVLQANKHESANIPHLKEQFESARKAVIESNSQRRKTISQKVRAEMEAVAKTKEELAALETAKATGTIVQCSACYDEYAPNKVVRCGSTDEHPVCFDCMKTYLGSEVGQGSSKLTCPCPDGCDDTFREPQLRLVPDAGALIDNLMRLRQEHDLRTAGIDDIESCPYCDFKTVCPPIHIDFEFHCQSPTCNITSCRKCKERTHIPDSCDEHQRKRDKESAIGHRRKIEEARSKALIRNCNKCKQPFIKSDGCNKMTCPQCANLQCYLCGVDVTADYAHFNRPGSKCPVYSQTITLEEQHAQEVKAATEAAEAEILREHPEFEKEDLSIKFFDDPVEVGRDMLDLDQRNPNNNIDVFHVADVARLRRRRFQAQGPAPNNNRAPPPPAVAGGHRVPYDPVAAVQAARYRVNPIAVFNPNAQQPNPAPLGGLDAALGHFDFGFNAHLGAPNNVAQAGLPRLDNFIRVPANQPDRFANHRGHRENGNRRQAPGGMPYNPVRQPQANVVRFAPLPAPIHAQVQALDRPEFDFNFNNPDNDFMRGPVEPDFLMPRRREADGW